MARISVSILEFLFDAKRKKESSEVMISRINKALKEREKDFDILHLDVEDGKFVKFKTFTPAQLAKIKCPKKREVHLMVVDYQKYLTDYFSFADMFIFHMEVLKSDFATTIEYLKKNHKYVGIAIEANTHVENIKYLDKVDVVLVMAIHPGLPGQKFIDTSLNKIKRLVQIRRERRLKFLIEVDGGIHKDNMQKVIDSGADILEMGTGFFNNV